MRKFFLAHFLSPVSSGFTLIELLVVITMMAVLTSLGIASYASYNGAQVVQTAAADVVNMLSTAKSQAISQVKPEACGDNPLKGYQVTIDTVSQQYILSAVCEPSAATDPNLSPDPNASPSASNTVTIVSKPLPPQVSFDPTSAHTMFFAISTGTVATPGTIIISGYGKTKTITVSSEGSISVN